MTTHIAYPIRPRPGLLCRECHRNPATYRATLAHKSQHHAAARYRCTGCVQAQPKVFQVAGPERPPLTPAEIPQRQRRLSRRETRDLERWARWHQGASA